MVRVLFYSDSVLLSLRIYVLFFFFEFDFEFLWRSAFVLLLHHYPPRQMSHVEKKIYPQ